jgi:peptidoglycan/LPS O-acetylase OafA/YrhL
MMRSTDLLVPRDAAAMRENNFDAIRLLMALLVVWSHCFALWLGTEDGEPISRLFGGVYNAGNIGVLAFFTISGFLITLSYERAKSPVQYLTKRVSRIYPGYLVAVTLSSLVVVPLISGWRWSDLTVGDAQGMVSNLLLRNFIVAADRMPAVNGALWSIPFEFWCYIGVLGLGLTGLIKWRWSYVIAAGGVMLVRIWLDATGRRPGGGMIELIIGYPYFWFNVAPPFLLGGAIYLNRDRLPRNAMVFALMLVATILASHLPIADPWRHIITQIMLPPTLAYGILLLAFSRTVRLPDAARFGDFSYGCYLYGFPIQRLIEHYGRGSIGFGTYIALSLTLSLVAGATSWYAVERWFLPRLRRQPDRAKIGPPLREEATVVAP